MCAERKTPSLTHNWKTGLLVFFCVRIACSPFVVSVGSCLTGTAYWAVTSVTLPLLSRDNSPTNPNSVHSSNTLLGVRWDWKNCWALLLHLLPNLFVIFPPSFPRTPLPQSPPPRWNEHFTRPETFNRLLLKKLIETSPLVTFCVSAYCNFLRKQGMGKGEGLAYFIFKCPYWL